jgi:hypothetical protein
MRLKVFRRDDLDAGIDELSVVELSSRVSSREFIIIIK